MTKIGVNEKYFHAVVKSAKLENKKNKEYGATKYSHWPFNKKSMSAFLTFVILILNG